MTLFFPVAHADCVPSASDHGRGVMCLLCVWCGLQIGRLEVGGRDAPSDWLSWSTARPTSLTYVIYAVASPDDTALDV